MSPPSHVPILKLTLLKNTNSTLNLPVISQPALIYNSIKPPLIKTRGKPFNYSSNVVSTNQ